MCYPLQYNVVLVEATVMVVFAGGKRTRAQAELWEGVEGGWHAYRPLDTPRCL